MNTDRALPAPAALPAHPQWISGFVDGEGSFQLSLSFRARMRFGVEVGLCFTIAQHKKSGYILDELHDYFRCGYIVNDTKGNCRVYRVKRLDDIRRIIIPFFLRYPLRTSKREDFHKFQAIHSLLTNGEMNNKEGLKHIVRIGYSMNSMGTQRKKSLETVLRMIGE